MSVLVVKWLLAAIGIVALQRQGRLLPPLALGADASPLERRAMTFRRWSVAMLGLAFISLMVVIFFPTTPIVIGGGAVTLISIVASFILRSRAEPLLKAP